MPPEARIEDGLTSQEAVAIALWNSPSFLATLADLGIARADLVEAGLLRNPVFSLLFPWGPKQLESTLQFPFDALWQRPRRVAAARLNARVPTLPKSAADADVNAAARHAEALLRTGALQVAIFNSANFSSIATDAMGVIQIFNVGAERMLGYAAAEVVNTITPADISDPQELIVRATALSTELGTAIAPGFDALVFKASRGIEDIYELTYIRKDGSRFPAVVSVTALRDGGGAIIGYLLIGTDNTARKQIEVARVELPDIIVLDLMMPDVNGFDVVAALNEHAETARIPILVVTAKQITPEERMKLHGYVTAVMQKAECDRDQFTLEVRRAMAGRVVA